MVIDWLSWFSAPDRSYLSLDWEPDMKKKYFDDRAAEVNLEIHTQAHKNVYIHPKRSHSTALRDRNVR